MRKELFFEFIGMKIKQKREEKGLTLDELSLKTGISKMYLQKIENGKAYGLSTTRFFRISDGLGTSASLLMKGWEEYNKHPSPALRAPSPTWGEG